ncbi:MAG: hypothetical protein GXC72_04560 [Chitinophagaceae bacterium]|nr:hypothetical protein [Chitinophagaceae bacterium]
MKVLGAALLLCFVVFCAFQLPTDTLCKTIRTGRFHSYRAGTGAHTIILRTDSLQLEIRPASKDTTFWKISWLSNCRFAAEYISGPGPRNEAELQRYRNTVLFYNIREITKDYYVGTTTVRGADGSNSYLTDTTWLRAR